MSGRRQSAIVALVVLVASCQLPVVILISLAQLSSSRSDFVMLLSRLSILRFGLLTLLSCYVFAVYAQNEDSDFSPRYGLAVQSTNFDFGGALELYLKPKISAWASVGVRQSTSRLSFGEDTTGRFTVPAETIVYENVQQRITVRAGVRFYETLKNEKWSGWYSPVIGYSTLSAPSSAYTQGFDREDLNSISFSLNRLEAERTLELGGEIGVRRWFWRKLYAEASVLVVGKRSLIDKKIESRKLDGGIHAALGIIF